MIDYRIKITAALAVAAALPLSACSEADTAESETSVATTDAADNGTLAQLVNETAGLSIVAGVVKDSGLAEVFDGMDNHTLLAPSDEALGQLSGDGGLALQDDANQAIAVGILRNHIIPGFVTGQAVRDAIKANGGEPVTMTTMGGGNVTFSLDGEMITVAGENGSTAKVGAVDQASNGVVMRIDRVLADLSTAS